MLDLLLEWGHISPPRLIAFFAHRFEEEPGRRGAAKQRPVVLLQTLKPALGRIQLFVEPLFAMDFQPRLYLR